jgi:hypothetical protein
VALLFNLISLNSSLFYNMQQVLVGLPQGVGGVAVLFNSIPYNLLLVYFYDTHQELVARRTTLRVWWP